MSYSRPKYPAPKSTMIRRIRQAGTGIVAAFAVLFVFPLSAWANPPSALPQVADTTERGYAPALDYDTDSCYNTPAIGSDGTLAPGLGIGGGVTENCRSESDLNNTNAYSRYKCNNGWCAIIYGYYFEKDQIGPGSSIFGHRHDWEHVVVWITGGRVWWVSTSCHGGYNIHHRNNVRFFEGEHPKVVYHKDGASTHCFRNSNNNDEPPENHHRNWKFPSLVGWNGYPHDYQVRISNHNWGKASFGLKDASWLNELNKAKPSDASVTFNPYG